ncbi:MAG TPA: serine hydrolase [Longimicrobiales bacterium]|nr:serine hydrolase [Longimicrobiales bacterium]
MRIVRAWGYGRTAAFVLAMLTPAAAGAQTGGTAPPDGSRDGLTHGLAAADSMIADAVASEAIPGAVLVVTRGGDVVHERAFGYAQLYDYGMRRLDPPRRMNVSTAFDLASVTKVMATTYAMMLLVDRGMIDIDAPVHRYLPEFRGVHLDSITVRHLLTHSAGLYQWQPLYYHAATAEQVLGYIRSLPLQWGVGEGRHYSDLGFMLLGYIVERVTGRGLDEFVHDALYDPLGLRATTFLPRARGLTDFAATSHGNPYERQMVHDTSFGYEYDGDPDAWTGWREYTLSGEVSDGNAWYGHGGVAGHAGLFSTGRELAVLLDVLLQRGVHEDRRILRPSVIDTFMRADHFGHGLGWQVPRDAPAGSFAHSGFTGTYVMGVPQYGLGIVLLINRQNLGVDDRGYYPGMALRTDVVAAILDAAADR